jgi:hypothetical protein
MRSVIGAKSSPDKFGAEDGTLLAHRLAAARERRQTAAAPKGGRAMALVPLLLIILLVFVVEGSLGCGFYAIEDQPAHA